MVLVGALKRRSNIKVRSRFAFPARHLMQKRNEYEQEEPKNQENGDREDTETTSQRCPWKLQTKKMRSHTANPFPVMKTGFSL